MRVRLGRETIGTNAVGRRQALGDMERILRNGDGRDNLFEWNENSVRRRRVGIE